jgi:hypothetical protein
MAPRIALFLVGVVIAAATLYAAVLPWQRLDSVTTEREFPEPSLKVTATFPGASAARRRSTEARAMTFPRAMVVSGLALSKQTRTEKTLSDPTLAALFIFAGGLIAAALFLNNLDEWEVAGAKFKRNREVIKEKAAAETIAAAKEEGRVTGDTVPLSTAKDLAVESADLAMQAQAVIAERRPWRQRRLGRNVESQGYVSAAYLEQVVRQVQAEHRAAHQGQEDEDDGQGE